MARSYNGTSVLLREIGMTLAAHGRDEGKATAILDAFSTQGRRLTAETSHRLYKDVLHTGLPRRSASTV